MNLFIANLSWKGKFLIAYGRLLRFLKVITDNDLNGMIRVVIIHEKYLLERNL